ncbi:MAG: four helix bundle protein [Candidatus Magasanikbacteria bacterium]|nr:four helix bundle protein [Candidatus Magasanikbacteria bacterium]
MGGLKFGYQNLEVSILAKNLIKEVYYFTNKFPPSEMYGITNQIRRSVVSVALNIAEGSGKKSFLDFNKYIRISIGSLIETNCALEISLELGYLKKDDFETSQTKIQPLYFKLISLSKYLINNKSKDKSPVQAL